MSLSILQMMLEASCSLFPSHDRVHILLFHFLLFFSSNIKTTIAKVRFIWLYLFTTGVC